MESTGSNHSQSQHGAFDGGAAQAFWQNLVTSQLAQAEAMLRRIDTSMSAGLEKSRANMAEIDKLSQSAFEWVAELQKSSVQLALTTLEKASETLSSLGRARA